MKLCKCKCECGCGELVKENQRFAWGHNRRGCGTNNRGIGWKHKPETIEKLKRPHSEDWNKKVSKARKGMVFSKEHRKRLSKSHKGKFNPEAFTKEVNEKRAETMRKKWKNLEFKEKVLSKIFESNNRKPNKVEILTDSLVRLACPKEFIYSGNGKIFIGGKCPDWFNINGKKQVIELFGNYFHSKKVTGRSRKQEEEVRKSHFKKYGYDCLIIWESELKNTNRVIQKIAEFNGGKIKWLSMLPTGRTNNLTN